MGMLLVVAEFINLICFGVCPGVNGYGYFCLIKLSSLFQHNMVTETHTRATVGSHPFVRPAVAKVSDRLTEFGTGIPVQNPR